MKTQNKGFTLIELLIVLAISSIVMTALYSAYHSQHRSYIIQEQVAAMQQNLRSAKLILEKELRMAGYDPNPDDGINPGVTANSDATTLEFEYIPTTAGQDKDGDGVVTIRYTLYDANSDGDDDLGRSEEGGANQAIAQNINAINFIYLDNDNNVLNHNSGAWDQADTPGDIRSVEVSIVARADREDLDFKDTKIYTNQQDEDANGADDVILVAQNDHYRRQALTFQVKCRNLEL